MKAKSWYFFPFSINKHLTKWMWMYNNYIARLNTLLFAFEPKMVMIDRCNSRYSVTKNVSYMWRAVNLTHTAAFPVKTKPKVYLKQGFCFFKKKWEAVMRIRIVICWRFWYQPVFIPKYFKDCSTAIHKFHPNILLLTIPPFSASKRH